MAALSLNGSQRGGRKNLICGICKEVYRSPRLLSCHHSFCSHCIEELVRIRGGRSFPCPACRKTITVPRGGASGFQANFYICDEDLELARKGARATKCSVHDEELVFFCVDCDEANCIRCRLTKHFHHEIKDLFEVSAGCQHRLETSRDRIQSAINCLLKKSAEAENSLKASTEKGTLLEKQVMLQHDMLAAKLGRRRDAALKKIEETNTSVVEKLSNDAQKINRKLCSLLQLQESVHLALGDAFDAERVRVDREMREGKGSCEKLKRVINSLPDTTVRLALHIDQGAISDDDIDGFLGVPTMLYLTFGAPTDIVVPIYQCGQEGVCREVHSLCHVTDEKIRISFGGTLPGYEGEDQIEITAKGYKNKRPTKLKYKDSKVYFVKYAEEKTFYSSCSDITGNTLRAKHGVLIKLSQCGSSMGQLSKVIVNSSNPLDITSRILFNIQSKHAVAFDATKDEMLFVIIDETTEQSQKAEYNVLLFHRNQSDPFTSYKPADKGFLPTDVCFWQEDGRQKLLVADAQNDSVHVVNVEEDACHFERYLAAGNGHLVRPTALDVDDRNRVWIGCGNGWILRCDKRTETDEPPCGNEFEASTSDGSSESSGAGDHSYNRRSPGGSSPVPSTSWQASLASHASLSVLEFPSPSSVPIGSLPSPTPSYASVASVATELSIRSTDTLSFLSE